MKKVILSVLITLLFLWGADTVSAEGKGKGGGGQGGRSIDKQADTNDLGKQGRPIREQKRTRGRFQNEATGQQKEPDRVREAQQKGKDKTIRKETAVGRGHQRQLRAIDRQINGEEAKHRSRVARLNRIRQLALEDSKTETVQRVDKLLEKEQKRYESKSQNMMERKQKALQLGEREAGKETKEAQEAAKKVEQVKKSEKVETEGQAKDANQ